MISILFYYIVALLALTLPAQNFLDLDLLDAAVREQRVRDSLAAVRAAEPVVADTTDYHSDARFPGEVFVAADSPVYGRIAACQAAIDSIGAVIASHPRGRELLGLDIADRKRFFDFLLSHALADTGVVFSWACGLRDMQVWEIRKLEFVLDTQTGNARAAVWSHITLLKRRLRDIVSYVVYLQRSER